jgi:hypothetical protein
LANDPAEVDVGRKNRAKRNGDNFSGVCASQRLEDTPRNTAQYETTEKHDDVLGEEDDEDEQIDGEQRSNHGLLVSKTVGDEAVKEQTRKLSNIGTVRKTGLPGCTELVGTQTRRFAELLLECGDREQVGDQDFVKSLHESVSE